MGYQSLPNRVLAFVLRKVKYTNARGTRSGCWGRGGGGKGGKVKTRVREKASHFQVFPKCQRKRNKKLHFLPCEPCTVHPKRASHLALGKGWESGWGVFTSPLGRKDPPGPLRSQSRPATLRAALGHFRSRAPALRQVVALPGAPAGLCAARAAPASEPRATGQLRARAGRRPRTVGEAGSLLRCPRAGGACGDGGGAAGRLPRQRAGGSRPGRWDQMGTSGCPVLPGERKGLAPRAVPLRTHLPTLRLPTAGSHRNPATKSFATPKAT